MDLAESIRAVLAIDAAAPAIEFGGHWTRWGALSGLAEGTARALDEAGLPAGAAVGVFMRNDPRVVGGMLGVLLGGRCIVTLNPHQGDAALAADLAKQRLPAVVALVEDWEHAPLHDGARAHGSLGIALRADGAAPVAGLERPGPGPHHAPLPGIAVEMLTSGTTGAPKRVPLAMAALERSLLGAKHYERDKSAAPRLRSGVAIVSAPLVHVGGLWRALQCVVDGRRFCLLERFRVDAWAERVKRYQPRTASLVPAALRMVLESDLDAADLASLQSVISGTAPLPPEDAEAFEARFGVPVLSSYGATEFAGGVAGWNLADHREWRAAKRGSVGRAHPGCALRVVDPTDGRRLPPGEEGLLEVRSAQLGRGEWVRTTDQAILDADGFLWITGRADAAILRGGFKVLPAEVAAVLERHPAVKEACVVGIPEPRLGAVPAAAVELAPGAAPVDEAALLSFAREHLARYQVPVAIRIVPALPRTPSLKVSQPGVRALFEERAAQGDA